MNAYKTINMNLERVKNKNRNICSYVLRKFVDALIIVQSPMFGIGDVTLELIDLFHIMNYTKIELESKYRLNLQQFYKCTYLNLIDDLIKLLFVDWMHMENLDA